jgi:hypothetical protein
VPDRRAEPGRRLPARAHALTFLLMAIGQVERALRGERRLLDEAAPDELGNAK